MSKGLIFLILLGCDDSASACDVLAQPPLTFASRATCQVVAEKLLDDSLHRPYPVLVTQCGTATETIAFLGTVASPEAVAAASKRIASIGGN